VTLLVRSLKIGMLAMCSAAAACASSRSGGSPGSGGAGAGMMTAGTGGAGAPDGADASATGHWVGTWACGPQLTETGNLPPPPGLTGNTLRQVIHVSIGGGQLRLRLSNAYGDGPVTMSSVHLAASSGASTIDPGTDQALTFSGASSVTVPMGQSVVSDAFAYPLAALSTLAITVHFDAVPVAITGHPGSRTTSYLQTGDAVTASSLPGAATADHWYFVTGLDVMAVGSSAAVVTLGDSLTDGRGSTTNGNDRWPDDLAHRLAANAPTSGVAVLNEGIGGNAVVSGGLGPTAVQRFAGDVLGQSGVRWLIVLEGVNDIGAASGQAVATNLIAAFGSFVDKAHGAGITAYGVPILPFGGSSYDTPDHQTARQTVNDWIRTSGKFDAVIDLETIVRDPANPANLLPAYDSGDHLHLDPAGYQAMAGAIDLSLFAK
jgi:lysophospholipase L1-like esterase